MSWHFQVDELARHLYPVRGEGGGPGATRLGIDAHALFASGRSGDGLEPEVAVDGEWSDGSIEARISGRVDGVVTTLHGETLFEVKSYGTPPADLAELEARFPHHLFQLQLYGALRASGGAAFPELRLVAVGLSPDGTPAIGEAREILVPPADVAADLDLAVRSLVRERNRVAARRRRRRAIDVPDPHDAWRPHQEEVVAFLERHGRAAVIAATGSGKTAPALAVACRRAFAEGRRLFWATAKTSGQVAVMETARALGRRGARLRALRVTAGERLCDSRGACPHVRGHRRACYEADVVKEATRRGFIEEMELLAFADSHGLCARSLQDDILELFDVLVGDYNFVVDPRLPGRSHLDGAVVVDEAHNLHSRVRESLSVQVRRAVAEVALADRWEVRELARAFLGALPALPGEGMPADYLSLLPLSRRASALFAASVDDGPGLPFLDELGHLAWALEDECNPRIGLADASDGGGVSLLCLDPAPFIRERFREVDPLVLLSATLDPPDVHLALLGLEELPWHVAPDPFASQRRVLLVPAAGSLLREREREAPKAARAIAALVNASPGRYLAFACSFDHAALVAAALEAEGVAVTSQSRGMDRHAVHRMATMFCRGGESGVLVAPAAGLLGEGIDLPPGLQGVFLLGPSLPAVTSERKAIQAYHDARGESGFVMAFLVPGLTRVIQAAGRVVRREGECAWVVLLDRRFARPPYRSLLPVTWQRAPSLTVEQAASALAEGSLAGLTSMADDDF